MLLRATPPPLTLAVMGLGNPVPGSKKPVPLADEPLRTTLTLAMPCVTVEGEQLRGDAGSGARSLITRTPQESVVLQYSCTVQKVMSSAGSTVVTEKSPQR